MESPELAISVGELIGVPKVSLNGSMDGWHEQAVAGILRGFRNQGTTSIVLDLGALSFAGYNGATALVNVLRSLGPEVCVHVVSSCSSASFLTRANLGPSVKLYSSTDELAENIIPRDDSYTSRWMASKPEDYELPLAA